MVEGRGSREVKKLKKLISHPILLLIYNVNRAVRLFSTFLAPVVLAFEVIRRLFLRSLSFLLCSNPMEKRVEQLGYDVASNRPGDGDCFYASVAKALGIETKGLKKVIFDFLKSHQFDVSIQPIVNSRTTKISLLCQLATIFTRIFGQNS